PPLPPASAWQAILVHAHDPVGIGHSMEPSPLGGAMIDAWLERYSDLAAPPLAQCSYARRATANPCNNPSAVRVGLRAPRRSPGPQYMPRSASPVGLARRVLRPQNNSTPDCCFYDPVVLGLHLHLEILSERGVYLAAAGRFSTIAWVAISRSKRSL